MASTLEWSAGSKPCIQPNPANRSSLSPSQHRQRVEGPYSQSTTSAASSLYNDSSTISNACSLSPLEFSSGAPSAQRSAMSLALNTGSAVEGGAEKGGLLPFFEPELISTPRPQGAPFSFSSMLTDDLDAMLDAPALTPNSGVAAASQSSQAWPVPVPSNGIAMAPSTMAQGISPLCPPLASPSAASAASSASLFSPSHQ